MSSRHNASFPPLSQRFCLLHSHLLTSPDLYLYLCQEQRLQLSLYLCNSKSCTSCHIPLQEQQFSCNSFAPTFQYLCNSKAANLLYICSSSSSSKAPNFPLPLQSSTPPTFLQNQPKNCSQIHRLCSKFQLKSINFEADFAVKERDWGTYLTNH